MPLSRSRNLLFLTLATAWLLGCPPLAGAAPRGQFAFHGRVVDESGAPVPETWVVVKGSRRMGTVVGPDGSYLLSVPGATNSELSHSQLKLRLQARRSGWHFEMAGGALELGIEMEITRDSTGIPHLLVRSNDPVVAATVANATVLDATPHVDFEVTFVGARGKQHENDPVELPSTQQVVLVGGPDSSEEEGSETTRVEDQTPAATAEPTAREVKNEPPAPGQASVKEPSPPATAASRPPEPAAPQAKPPAEPPAPASPHVPEARGASSKAPAPDSLPEVGAGETPGRQPPARAAETVPAPEEPEPTAPPSTSPTETPRATPERAATAPPTVTPTPPAPSPPAQQPPAHAPSEPAKPQPAASSTGAAAAQPPPKITLVGSGPITRPAQVPSPRPAQPESCQCLIRGTVEVDAERPLEESTTMVVLVDEEPAVRDTVVLFMGSPRAFSLRGVSCGPHRLRLEIPGRHHPNVLSKSAIDCGGGGTRNTRMVLIPAGRGWTLR